MKNTTTKLAVLFIVALVLITPAVVASVENPLQNIFSEVAGFFADSGEHAEISGPVTKTVTLYPKPVIEREGSNYVYRASGNRYNVTFAPDTTKDLLSVTVGDARITMSPVDPLYTEAEKNFSLIGYDNVYENTHLVYRTQKDRLKELIKLEKYTGVSEWTFKLDVENAVWGENEQGDIVFSSPDGEFLWKLDKPYMWDSPRPLIDYRGSTSYDTSMEIFEEKGQTYLTVAVDDEWLQEAYYPVMIDPTITFNATEVVYEAWVTQNVYSRGGNFKDPGPRVITKHVPSPYTYYGPYGPLYYTDYYWITYFNGTDGNPYYYPDGTYYSGTEITVNGGQLVKGWKGGPGNKKFGIIVHVGATPAHITTPPTFYSMGAGLAPTVYYTSFFDPPPFLTYWLTTGTTYTRNVVTSGMNTVSAPIYTQTTFNNNYYHPTLYTTVSSYGYTNQKARAVIDWNTSIIPDTATINSVNLKLYFPSLTDVNISVYGLSGPAQSLGDTAAWQGDGTIYNRTENTGGVATYITFILSAAAATDLENNLGSDWFGMGLRLDELTLGRYAFFRSSHQGHVPTMPHLIINYTEGEGPAGNFTEGYYAMESDGDIYHYPFNSLQPESTITVSGGPYAANTFAAFAIPENTNNCNNGPVQYAFVVEDWSISAPNVTVHAIDSNGAIVATLTQNVAGLGHPILDIQAASAELGSLTSYTGNLYLANINTTPGGTDYLLKCTYNLTPLYFNCTQMFGGLFNNHQAIQKDWDIDSNAQGMNYAYCQNHLFGDLPVGGNDTAFNVTYHPGQGYNNATEIQKFDSMSGADVYGTAHDNANIFGIDEQVLGWIMDGTTPWDITNTSTAGQPVDGDTVGQAEITPVEPPEPEETAVFEIICPATAPTSTSDYVCDLYINSSGTTHNITAWSWAVEHTNTSNDVVEVNASASEPLCAGGTCSFSSVGFCDAPQPAACPVGAGSPVWTGNGDTGFEWGLLLDLTASTVLSPGRTKIGEVDYDLSNECYDGNFSIGFVDNALGNSTRYSEYSAEGVLKSPTFKIYANGSTVECESTPCTLDICPAGEAPPTGTCECTSCSECTAKINSVNCTTVNLTANILDNDSSCVNINTLDKTFDCLGNVIDGDDSGMGQVGIVVGNSNITVRNCNIADFDTGIYIGDENNDNQIYDNYIGSNNIAGIVMGLTTQNTIYNNDLHINTIGINSTSGSFGNLLYGNNFTGNTLQAVDDSAMGGNEWNNSYPIGGNYWDDFDTPGEGCSDNYQAANQSVPGSDGICDRNSPAPYNISGSAGSNDSYPLFGAGGPVPAGIGVYELVCPTANPGAGDYVCEMYINTTGIGNNLQGWTWAVANAQAGYANVTQVDSTPTQTYMDLSGSEAVRFCNGTQPNACLNALDGPPVWTASNAGSSGDAGYTWGVILNASGQSGMTPGRYLVGNVTYNLEDACDSINFSVGFMDNSLDSPAKTNVYSANGSSISPTFKIDVGGSVTNCGGAPCTVDICGGAGLGPTYNWSQGEIYINVHGVVGIAFVPNQRSIVWDGYPGQQFNGTMLFNNTGQDSIDVDIILVPARSEGFLGYSSLNNPAGFWMTYNGTIVSGSGDNPCEGTICYMPQDVASPLISNMTSGSIGQIEFVLQTTANTTTTSELAKVIIEGYLSQPTEEQWLNVEAAGIEAGPSGKSNGLSSSGNCVETRFTYDPNGLRGYTMTGNPDCSISWNANDSSQHYTYYPDVEDVCISVVDGINAGSAVNVTVYNNLSAILCNLSVTVPPGFGNQTTLECCVDGGLGPAPPWNPQWVRADIVMANSIGNVDALVVKRQK